MNDLKTVVLTGATGCIGRNVLDQLVNHPSNPDIYILHRRNAKLERLYDVKYNKLHFCYIDPDDYSSFLSAIPHAADVIIHTAGNTSFHKKDAVQQYKDNVILTDHLINASLFNGVEKFIFTSTGAVHADINSNYVKTKKTSEKLVWRAFSRHGLNSTILQPAVVIGKHDYNNYYNIFKGISNKTIKRSLPGSMEFCSATEVAKAHIAAINTKPGSVYTLGGYYTTWRCLFRMIHVTIFPSTQQYHQAADYLYEPYNKYWLKFLSYLESFKKNPRLTPEVVNLLSSGKELSEDIKKETKKHLDYNSHLCALSDAIGSYTRWLKSKDMII